VYEATVAAVDGMESCAGGDGSGCAQAQASAAQVIQETGGLVQASRLL